MLKNKKKTDISGLYFIFVEFDVVNKLLEIIEINLQAFNFLYGNYC
jgi:hypothetical protein